MAISDWTFYITDVAGGLLPQAALATSIRISRVWNGPRMLEATIPLAADISGALDIGKQLVLAVRQEASGAVVRFHGMLWSRVYNYSISNPTVTITAVDPWSLLGKRYTATNFVLTDQGVIAQTLVNTENAISNVYIDTSTNPAATKYRDRSWADQPRPVSEAIQSFTTILDPVDIDLVPKEFDTSNNTIVDLIITPRVYGADPVFTLGWGEGTVDNCVGITDESSMEQVGNYVIGTGELGVTSTQSNATSITLYGRHVRNESFDSVSEQATVDDHTLEVLQQNAYPLPQVKVTPRNGSGIMLWDDFDVGDVVDVDARYGDVTTYVSSRVIEATVEVDGNGERITEIGLEETRA